MEVKLVCSGTVAKARMPLFNIYLMEMAEELERAQLGDKLEGCWYGTLLYADDVVLVANSRAKLQAMLDVVEAYVKVEDESYPGSIFNDLGLRLWSYKDSAHLIQ